MDDEISDINVRMLNKRIRAILARRKNSCVNHGYLRGVSGGGGEGGGVGEQPHPRINQRKA